MAEYNFREIENRWQKKWSESHAYKVEIDHAKPKYYVLDMFPYPSGAGLHVGHPLGYIATDIYSRHKRNKGYNVLHPMGYDAFGLPAEQYAIQTGQHPAKTTEDNIATYRRQLDNIGFNYDWNREIRTANPQYYKWTQWIFGLLFESYYDKSADKALPIDSLTKRFSEDGNLTIDAHCDDDTPELSAAAWEAMTRKEQSDILMKYRLAFLKNTTVNWCPDLGTVLANEEVKNGVSERGGYPVIRKEMKQWCLRITAYSEKLLQGLDTLDWPDAVKEMQRNWIGKSQGASLRFQVENSDLAIEVFTTRVDTAFGVSFLSLAPEHEWALQLTTPDQASAVEEYIKASAARSERDRMADTKTISGVFTGSYAINPFNGERVPIWLADYVLAGYGTGAVMAVPCSDTRDYAFAQHFGLPITRIQEGPKTDIGSPDFDAKAGKMVNSGFLNGMQVKEAIPAAIAHAEVQGFGKSKTQYRFRDAIFSRQRYWGEPFPIAYDKEGIPYLIDRSALPLVLPEVDKFLPTNEGNPPLGRASDWTLDGDDLELNTMPGWAGSSWYFFRYLDPHNQEVFASKEAMAYWGQVDLYLGGAEHATGHLLYARFWTQFLYDLGFSPIQEPFKKLINQGMIQGVSEVITAYSLPADADLSKTPTGKRLIMVSADATQVAIDTALGGHKYTRLEIHADISLVKNSVLDIAAFCKWRVEYQDAFWLTNAEGLFKTHQEVEKMSKSKYNVVNPDDIIERYGSDTFRVYEMFLGPLEQSKPWSMQGIEGSHKFLKKFWNLFFDKEANFEVSNEPPTAGELKTLHKTIKKVEEEIEKLSFNTCVSTFMVCVNELQEVKCSKRAILEPLTIVLSSFAPHVCSELWKMLGHGDDDLVIHAPYPQWEEKYLEESSFECPISVNGKLRHKVLIDKNLTQAEIESMVLSLPEIKKWLEDKAPKKVIYVPNRMVNLVV